MLRDRPLRCELAAGFAPRIADGRSVPAGIGDHVATCLRCQAEVVRHRRAVRQLHGLRDHAVTVPAGAVDATLEALHALPEGERWVVTWSAPSVVAAAGAAAGVAGVLAWRRRWAG